MVRAAWPVELDKVRFAWNWDRGSASAGGGRSTHAPFHSTGQTGLGRMIPFLADSGGPPLLGSSGILSL